MKEIIILALIVIVPILSIVIGHIANRRAKRKKASEAKEYIVPSMLVGGEDKKVFVQKFMNGTLTQEEIKEYVLALNIDLSIFMEILKIVPPRPPAEVNLKKLRAVVAYYQRSSKKNVWYINRAFKLSIIALALADDQVSDADHACVAGSYAVYNRTKEHVWDLNDAFVLAVNALLVTYKPKLDEKE